MSVTGKVFLAFGLGVLGISQASASGFQIIEQSVSGMGRAFAGSEAVSDDASTIFFNPGGLGFLEHQEQLLVAFHGMTYGAEFRNEGSSLNPLLAGAGASLPGGDNAEAGGSVWIPNFYYAKKINENWMAGIGVNAPFGLTTDYPDNWIGRYHATESTVKTININPTLNYKVNSSLSIGFGINVQYIEAILANRLDSAAICLSAADAATCGAVDASLVQAGNAAIDSYVEMSGDNIATGYNMGVVYQPDADLKIGFSYRSSISHKLKGNADFELSAPLQTFLTIAASPLFQDTSASAGVDLPEIVSLGLAWKVRSDLELMGGVQWTCWDKFKELVIDFDNLQPDSVTPENWTNTYRVSLGFDFQANPNVELRAGIAYDDSPVDSVVNRTARIPDSSRRWYTIGMGYRLTDQMQLDLAYARLVPSASVINNQDISFGHMLSGHYEGGVDILSAQMVWNLE